MKIINFIVTLFSVTKASVPQPILQIDLGNDKCLSNDKGKATSCDESYTWFLYDGASSTLCSKDDAKTCITIKGKLDTKKPATFSRKNSMLVSKSDKKTKCIATDGKKLIKLKSCATKPMPTEIDGNGYLKVSEKECIVCKKSGRRVKIGKCDKANVWKMDKDGKIKHVRIKGCLEMKGKKIVLADCKKASSWKLGDSMVNESEQKCLYRARKKTRFSVQSCMSYLKFNLSQIIPPTTQAPTTQAPTTQAPTTQAPTTQAPTTAKPDTCKPVDGLLLYGISKNNLIGYVTTTKTWTLEFSFKINVSTPLKDKSINYSLLHFGNGQYDSHPEIMYFAESATKGALIVRTSECGGKTLTTTGANLANMLYSTPPTLGKYYNIKIETTEYNEKKNLVSYFLDGTLKLKSYLNICDAYKANVYAGSQWGEPTNAHIKDLKYNGKPICGITPQPTPKPTPVVTTQAPTTTTKHFTCKPEAGLIDISKNNLIGTVTTTKNWTLEFSIKYNDMPDKSDHFSLLHFGNGKDQDEDRHPRIWVTPTTTRLALSIQNSHCGGKRHWAANGAAPNVPRTQDRYYNVRITSTEVDATKWSNFKGAEFTKINMLKIYVDGSYVSGAFDYSCGGIKTNVYAGSPWRTPAPLCMKNLKYNGKAIEVIPKTTPKPTPVVTTQAPTTTPKPVTCNGISKNNNLGAITTTRNYTLEFSIQIKSQLKTYASILHIGNGQFDRHPEIILVPHSTYTLYMHVKSSPCNNNTNSNSGYVHRQANIYLKANMNQYYNIKIETKQYKSSDEKYNLTTIYVDGVKVTGGLLMVCDAYKANVYAGSPWYEPANVCIKDLKYNGEAISDGSA